MTQEQDTAPAPPQPTAEHIALKDHCGTWNVDCTFCMPDQEMKVQATEEVTMLGQFWTTSVFRSEMFGMPFEGHATLGFDPHTGKYVSTWMDSMTPTLYKFSGQYDSSGKILELNGSGFDCMMQAIASYRTTEEHKDDGTRVFEMFMTPEGGEEMRLFTHIYTKAS